MIALQGCELSRSPDGDVEIVEASVAHRMFPPRVSTHFGVCWKSGPSHQVTADGKSTTFPEAALCIRAAGCVWSTEGTGPVGFVSIDVAASLLPEGLSLERMTFVPASVLPGFVALSRSLARLPSTRIAESICGLVLALEEANVMTADELREQARPGTAPRVRAAMQARLTESPSLVALAAELGTNRFALMRDFKRHFAMTPHAFLITLRVERARELIARGADLAEVAIACGFSDQAHLTRCFKRLIGMTPGAYARQARALAVVP